MSSQHLQEMVIKSAYPTQGEDPVFGQTLTREELSALETKNQGAPRALRRAEASRCPARRRR